MLKMIKYILWLVVITALVLGFDLVMVQVPLEAPGLKQAQNFYVDFRTRILGLTGDYADRKADEIETVIDKSTTPPAEPMSDSRRYLYVDDNGALQFADSLQQVPIKYRQDAQPLAE